MLADVGLLGFPNVGKSTIISTVSSAKPKIANYHFTTLEPALGVVRTKSNNGFVMADIPGIIEGASEGVGLGLKFLKHIERTRILLHVIDITGSEGRDPIDDFNKINDELKKYSEKLAKKEQIVVANKIDSLTNYENLERLENLCKNKNLKLFKVSAVTKQGLDELMEYISKRLNEIPKEDIVNVDDTYEVSEKLDQTINVYKKQEDYYVVDGAPIERLMGKVNIFDSESIKYLQKCLNGLGIMDRLKKLGLKDGDTIDIDGYQLEYSE